LTTTEFAKEVFTICASCPVIVSTTITGLGVTWIRIRAILVDSSFIEAFFNEATNKTAYALVKGNKRIFGADNTHGWHWHPFAAPDTHIPAPEPISFIQFLQEVESHLQANHLPRPQQSLSDGVHIGHFAYRHFVLQPEIVQARPAYQNLCPFLLQGPQILDDW